jgi:hypothetical protein
MRSAEEGGCAKPLPMASSSDPAVNGAMLVPATNDADGDSKEEELKEEEEEEEEGEEGGMVRETIGACFLPKLRMVLSVSLACTSFVLGCDPNRWGRGNICVH